MEEFDEESSGSVAEGAGVVGVEDTDNFEGFVEVKGFVDVLALDCSAVGPDVGGDHLVVGAVHLADRAGSCLETNGEGNSDGVAGSVACAEGELELVGRGLADDYCVQGADDGEKGGGGGGVDDGGCWEDHFSEGFGAVGDHGAHHEAE